MSLIIITCISWSHTSAIGFVGGCVNLLVFVLTRQCSSMWSDRTCKEACEDQKTHNWNEFDESDHMLLPLHLDRVKRIWYLSPNRAAKVQASLRIRAVSPEPSLLAYTSSESRGTFRQKVRSQAPLNGWACAVKICHDGMLEDINSLDGAHLSVVVQIWYVAFTLTRQCNSSYYSCGKQFKCIHEPRQANLCLRAFRHYKF